MPSPGLRNKGESLAHHIDTNAGARKVANDRDNLVASRTRKDAKWEAAAARLSPLEQRAAQVRVDYERADHLARYSTAVKEGRAKPPTPATGPRYWLGHCLDCDRELWEHRPRPRVPLCRSCRGRRSR